jgi:hypothetical protein
MSKLITVAAAAALLSLTAVPLMAQDDARKSPASKGSEGTTATKDKTTDSTVTTPGVGSRAMGPVTEEKPTDPAKPLEPEVKKLEKETTKE